MPLYGLTVWSLGWGSNSAIHCRSPTGLGIASGLATLVVLPSSVVVTDVKLASAARSLNQVRPLWLILTSVSPPPGPRALLVGSAPVTAARSLFAGRFCTMR